MPVKQKKRYGLLIVLSVLILILIGLLVWLYTSPAPELQLPPAPQLPTLSEPESNPYGPEDFQYKDGYLTCLAGKSVLGIDVSAHQYNIDWEAVAAAGVEFVMIRAGFRGLTWGMLEEDAYAQINYAGAKKAGLKVGAYFFSQATSEEEALEEARFLLDVISHWELDLPVVYDWEYGGSHTRTKNADSRTVTDCAIAFCKRISLAGYEPMVYFNPHHAENYLHLEELTDYPFWLAFYTDNMSFPYKMDMWQYTSTGSVPGIEGNVDINLWFPE